MSYEGGIPEIELFEKMYGKINISNYLRPKSGIFLRRSWKKTIFMIKTLIIGGTGYLGRHLYNVLIETRNEVYITSRINNNIKKLFRF